MLQYLQGWPAEFKAKILPCFVYEDIFRIIQQDSLLHFFKFECAICKNIKFVRFSMPKPKVLRSSANNEKFANAGSCEKSKRTW